MWPGVRGSAGTLFRRLVVTDSLRLQYVENTFVSFFGWYRTVSNPYQIHAALELWYASRITLIHTKAVMLT
jgi:hypothetical protein